MKMYIQFQS